MKLFTIIAAGFALAACQKNLPAVLSDSGEIRFGTTGIRVETKAFTESTANVLQTKGFKAAAVIDTDKSTMFNADVAYNSGDGTFTVPDKHYYFPESGTMSFYAAYPASQVISIANDGAATMAYTSSATDPYVDLVAAKATGVVKTPSPVLMTFGHLLSQVTATARTDDSNVICKLYSITITDAAGGTYTFANDSWALSETNGDYAFMASDDGQVITTEAAATGAAMTFMPGDVLINVKWKCYNKDGGQMISDNDQTVAAELTQGEHAVLGLTLPANASEIKLTIEVAEWVEVDKDITVQPDAFCAVNAVADETVTLPTLNISEGAAGRVDWGDSTIETFSNEGTKSSVSDNKITLSHAYAAAFSGKISIYVDKGVISGEVEEEDLVKFTVNNTTAVSLSKKQHASTATFTLLPGVFTVNDSGKKVKFAPGNLLWNGEEFSCEDNQYDYSTGVERKSCGIFPLEQGCKSGLC